MLKTDKRIIKAARKLTNSMSDDICFDPTTQMLHVVKDFHAIVRSTPLKMQNDIYKSAVERLVENGYFRYSIKYDGGIFIQITDRIVLRNEYFWDSFSKRFLSGFLSGLVSGIIVTVLGGLLLSYLQVMLGI